MSPKALSGQAPAPQDYSQRFAALATAPGLSDSARLHRLFDLDWEYGNVASPENATYNGYPGQNDRWTDLSVPAIQRRRADFASELKVIGAINRARLNPADQLSYDIFKRGVEEFIEGTRFPGDLLQISQLGGPQTSASTIGSMPAQTVKDYTDIIARLRALPTVVDQTIALLDSGVKLGVTPPRITLRDVPGQVTDLIPEDPMKSALLAPFTSFPVGIAESDRARLRADAVRAYNEQDRPAFQRLQTYLTNTYIPRSRETIGMNALPKWGGLVRVQRQGSNDDHAHAGRNPRARPVRGEAHPRPDGQPHSLDGIHRRFRRVHSHAPHRSEVFLHGLGLSRPGVS